MTSHNFSWYFFDPQTVFSSITFLMWPDVIFFLTLQSLLYPLVTQISNIAYVLSSQKSSLLHPYGCDVIYGRSLIGTQNPLGATPCSDYSVLRNVHFREKKTERRRRRACVCVCVCVSVCERERKSTGNCKRQGCHVWDYLRWSIWKPFSLTITQKHTPLAFLRFTITPFFTLTLNKTNSLEQHQFN